VMGPMKSDQVESFCGWLLEKALQGGAVDADVFYAEGESRHISLREGLPEEDTNGFGHSVTLRLLMEGGRQGLATINRFDRADLSELVKWSLANAAVSEPDPFAEIGEGPRLPDGEDLRLEDPDLKALTHEQRTRACLEMTEAAKGPTRGSYRSGAPPGAMGGGQSSWRTPGASMPGKGGPPLPAGSLSCCRKTNPTRWADLARTRALPERWTRSRWQCRLSGKRG
jgi:Predicted Zn-dependent proteases and their inactivated homologs